MGSQVGVAIAALVMIGAFELFRELAEARMLVFGAAMVGIMVLRPRGLVATREPSIYLKQKKTIAAEYVAEGRA
jgi:branched-chain amino acid transport system permease protein